MVSKQIPQELSPGAEVVGMTWCCLWNICCSSQTHFRSKLICAQGMGRSCSQSQRAVEVGKNIWRSSSPTLVHDLVLGGSEHPPSLSRQPVPMFEHSWWRSFFSFLNWISCVSKFVPIASCPVTSEKSLTAFFTPPLCIFTRW